VGYRNDRWKTGYLKWKTNIVLYMTKDGILYIGTAPPYYEEAKISAKTAKEHNDVPIAIITSSSLSERAETCPYFDEAILINKTNLYDDVRDKIYHMSKSPFENTIYIDGDTFILDDITPVFDMLSRFDITASHALVRPVVTVDCVPDSFPELNTGVIGFTSSGKVNRFFEKWKNIHKNQMWSGRPHETVTLSNASSLDDIPFGKKHGQPPFREALYHSDLQFSALPTEYNYRGNVWAYDSVKIVHMGHGITGSRMKNKINTTKGGRTYVHKNSRLYFASGPTVPLLSRREQFFKKSKNLVWKLITYIGIESQIRKLYYQIRK